MKFRTDKGRDPDPQSFAEDGELLRQIRDDVLGALDVSSDLLSDDFTRYKEILNRRFIRVGNGSIHVNKVLKCLESKTLKLKVDSRIQQQLSTHPPITTVSNAGSSVITQPIGHDKSEKGRKVAVNISNLL